MQFTSPTLQLALLKESCDKTQENIVNLRRTRNILAKNGWNFVGADRVINNAKARLKSLRKQRSRAQEVVDTNNQPRFPGGRALW